MDLKSFFKDWGLTIFIVAAFLVVRFFVFVPVSVSGHSMDPTLANGQRLVVSRLASIKRFNIVTTKEPDDVKRLAVKRVIGLPGDLVEMKNDVLTINGKEYKEPYLDGFKEKFHEDKLQKQYQGDLNFQERAMDAKNFTSDFSVTVPKESYFVLGDNRIVSKDSRIFGMVDEKFIQGKVAVRYWPFADRRLF